MEAVCHPEGALLQMGESTEAELQQLMTDVHAEYWGVATQPEPCGAEDRFRLYTGAELASAGLLPKVPQPKRQPSVLNLIDFNACNKSALDTSQQDESCKAIQSPSRDGAFVMPAAPEAVARAARPCMAKCGLRGPRSPSRRKAPRNAKVLQEAFVNTLEARDHRELCASTILLWRNVAKETQWESTRDGLEQANAKLRLKINKAVTLLSQRR